MLPASKSLFPPEGDFMSSKKSEKNKDKAALSDTEKNKKTAAPAARKRLPGGAVAGIITAAVVVIAAVVVLFLNRGSAEKNTMTIDGKDFNVYKADFYTSNDSVLLSIGGKKGSEDYVFVIRFKDIASDAPKADTEYTEEDIKMLISYTPDPDSSGALYNEDVLRLSVSDYTPDGSMKVTISGTAREHFSGAGTIDFTISGTLNCRKSN